MRVAIDEVWSSPSTLHMRVLVWGPENKWRHKYWTSVPFDDLPEEVITALVGHLMDSTPEEDHQQTALF